MRSLRRAERIVTVIAVCIALADTALIGIAVDRSNGPAPAASTATRTSVAFPAPATEVPAGRSRRVDIISPSDGEIPGEPAAPTTAAGPVDIAAPPVGIGRTAPRADRATAPQPTASATGIQVLGESRSLDDPTSEAQPPATTPPTPPPAEVTPGSGALLALSDGGTVVRAAPGACPATAPATIQASTDGGRSWVTARTDAAQVLALGSAGGGGLWAVGADSACRPIELTSTDDGRSWQRSPAGAHWSLSPDREATQVVGPGFVTDVGCVPRSLAAVGAAHAMVACADGRIRSTGDSGARWVAAPHVGGAVAAAMVDRAVGYALAAAPGCPVQVLVTRDGGASWTPAACVPGTGPQAISAAGSRIVVQAGRALWLSADAGRTWSSAGH